jgi:SIR2-like domain
MTLPSVPPALVRAIADGRCVAFLGAGMSQPDAPDWLGLLRQLAATLPKSSHSQAALDILAGTQLNAHDLEAVAQILRDACPDDAAFEGVVHQVLGKVIPNKTAERYRLLREIPFESILTTNFDSLIKGVSPGARIYEQLLRGRAKHSRHWQFSSNGAPNVIKLHGDANGSAVDNPVVLARSDYRRRLYQDGRYSNFLRAIFATRTVLFLGVSFTDAYLNELRSEVLALVHDGTSASDEPIGYAIMPDRPLAWCDFMRRHDGIEILRYETKTDPGHSGFNTWLERIHSETASGPRVARLLRASAAREGTNAQVVWIDRKPMNNIGPEVDELRRGGVDIVQLADPGNLTEREHGRAALMITSFTRSTPVSLFDNVMDRVNGWATRPPVVVFTSPSNVTEKRGHCLRRGAVDVCSAWSSLFDIIERLFRE